MNPEDIQALLEKAKAGLGAAEDRDLIAVGLTPAQLAEAQKWAREWKPKATGETR